MTGSSPEMHRSAAHGYATGADAYHRGRPDYPAAIDDWLRRIGVRRGAKVIDLGAGSGKFTGRLVDLGADVVAVEPVAEMLATLRGSFPGIEAISATAENMPLSGGCADVVVCAQSFHWFASETALREIQRVLRPGGQLGLVWNMRDDSKGGPAALSAIIAPYEGDTPRAHSGAWRALFPAAGFGPLDEAVLAHGHEGPPERVVLDRTMSVSFIAALPPARKEAIAGAVRKLIDTHPDLAGRTTVTFPYRTVAYSCERL